MGTPVYTAAAILREYENPKLLPASFGRGLPRELDRVRRSDETLRRNNPDLQRAKYEIAIHHLRSES